VDGLEITISEPSEKVIIMVDLSVIIVSYNVRAYLEQALHSITKALSNISSEIIVVDNASWDGSVAMLHKQFPRIRVLANSKNVGFAKANNQAIQLAKGKIISLINPDTLVREDTFSTCLEYIHEHADVGALGCKILNPDGTLQLACRRHFPTPWIAFTKIIGLSTLFPKTKMFGQYNLTYLNPDKISEVEALSGSFMLVRKAVIDEVGLLDESFFLYGEDLDWCYRIHQKGWKIIYLPHTQIIHYKGQSTQKAALDNLRIFYQAMQLFARKHFRKKGYTLFYWIILLGIWLRGMLSFIARFLARLTIPFIDILLVQLGLVISLFFRFGNLDPWLSYIPINLVYTLIWIGCLTFLGLYKPKTYSFAKSMLAVLIGLVLNTSITFFFPQYQFSRQVVLVAGAFNGLFISGWRLAIRLASHFHRIPFIGTIGKTLLKKRVLIIGTKNSALQLYRKMKRKIDSGYDVAGMAVLGEGENESLNGDSIPVIGKLAHLESIVKSYHIQEIIFTHEGTSYQEILSIIARGRGWGVDFKMVPQEMDVVIGRASIDPLDEWPLLDINYKYYWLPNRMVKRLLDIFIAILLLPLIMLSFFYIFIHPKLRLHLVSMTGMNGKTFPICMVYHGGQIQGGWVGVAPQFLAVLAGKMSLVGCAWKIGQKQLTLDMKPGITGLLQIQKNTNLSNEEKKRFQTYYLKNYTILLDAEILFKAIFRL